MKPFAKTLVSLTLALLLSFAPAARALAFCGFYVGGADAKLFNKASQVIIAHQGDRTVLTMANDFQGEVKDFALVVPVPTAISREQVKVSDRQILKKLDQFSQPRLVEYTDPDPCAPAVAYDAESMSTSGAPMPSASAVAKAGRSPNLGVTVEDRFKVNEYEILILSAKESDGLEIWLNQNGYKLPSGASAVLQPYIRQKMKFFVAKVDLKEFDKNGDGFLRPLQISYKSPKFMLPIRLGMVNAQGEQDLLAYILSPKGQVEVTNYRTVKIPSNQEIPEFVQSDFGTFYKSTFQRAYEQADKKVAFMEYAWDTSNCDPCSSEPPTSQELRQAGAFWVQSNPNSLGGATFITRLHVRYARDKFAEDLVFQQTSNREQFQGRYVLNHPHREGLTCEAARDYQKKVVDRQAQEASNLVTLTGWQLADVQKQIQPISINVADDNRFWIWKLFASIWKGLFG
jgi:hypothetical protein